MIRIYLKYDGDGNPVISSIGRVSRPGRREYRGVRRAPEGPERPRHRRPLHEPGRLLRPRGPRRGRRRRDPLRGLVGTAMSRIGKIPVTVPAGVTVDGRRLARSRSRARRASSRAPSTAASPRRSRAARSSSPARATRPSTARSTASTARSCRAWSTGVSTGFEKRLEIVGVSYQAKLAGRTLTLQVGFCNPVVLEVPKGVTVECPQPTLVIIRGHDKQLVGQFAAEIRQAASARALQGQGRALRRRGRSSRRPASPSWAGRSKP